MGAEEVGRSSRVGVSVGASGPASDTLVGITSFLSANKGVKDNGSSRIGDTSPCGARCRMETVDSRPSERCTWAYCRLASRSSTTSIA